MHVDSVATNAARQVIQPLDDVATALKLDRGGLRTRAVEGGHLQRPALLHPARRAPARLLLQQVRHGEGRPRPREAADERRRVRRRARRAEGQGHPGPLGEPLPVHRRTHRPGAHLPVRRHPLQRGRHAGALGRGARRQGADLVRRTWSRTATRPAKIAQDADIIALQNGKTAFNWNGIWTDQHAQGEEGPRVGRRAAAQHRRHQGGVGWLPPVRACRRMRTPDENKPDAARVFLNWISTEEPRVGQGRSGAGAQQRAGVRRVQGADRTSRPWPTRSTTCTSCPRSRASATPCRSSTRRSTLAVIGGQDPATVLSDAAGRATKILEANKKKYGG